jgi:hypothetical protein
MKPYYLTVYADGVLIYSAQVNAWWSAWEAMWIARNDFLSVLWIRRLRPRLKICIRKEGPMHPGYEKILCVLHT